MKMNDVEYYPAISGDKQQLYHKIYSKEVNSRIPRFLLSFFYVRKLKNIRKIFNTEEDVKIIIDSGGFQNITQNANINPKELISWYNREKPDWGFSLDVPPLKQTLKGSSMSLTDVNENEFEKCLKKTIENCQVMEKYKDENLRILNVLHGNTFDRINKWYDGIKDFSFTGYSFAPKPASNPFVIALGILFLKEKGWNGRLHILGASGLRALLVQTLFKKDFRKISFDSASFIISGQRRAYSFSIRGTGNHQLSYISDIKILNNQENILPCKCEFCLEASKYDIKSNNFEACLAMHNMLYTENLNYAINRVYNTPWNFENICNPDKTMRDVLKFIEFAERHGVENATIKYKDKIKYKEPDNTKQKNVFSYDNC